MPTNQTWLCKKCHLPYDKIWVVGERDGVLQRLIGLYKFERVISAHKTLGDLLLETLPDFPTNTIVLSIPTTPSRIRERGYDHMMLIAKYIAKKRGLKYKKLIIRKNNTKQRQSNAKQRKLQAKNAFTVNGHIDSNIPYLIIDDVFTTGATVKYAAKALRDSGARNVWIAVVARQTLR